MTFKEMVWAHAKRTDLSLAEARQQIKSLFKLIHQRVTAGEEVGIPGFGKFCLRRRQRFSNMTKKLVESQTIHFVRYRGPRKKRASALRKMAQFAEEQGKV
jgi:nucleoid DNA-binding protein